MERREFLAGISGAIAGSQVKAEAVSCENPVFIDVSFKEIDLIDFEMEVRQAIRDEIEKALKGTKFENIPVFIHSDDVTMSIKEIPKP